MSFLFLGPSGFFGDGDDTLKQRLLFGILLLETLYRTFVHQRHHQ